MDESRKTTTVIRKCTCPHDFQDVTYGSGMRVYNILLKDKPAGRRGRCTVCRCVADMAPSA